MLSPEGLLCADQWFCRRCHREGLNELFQMHLMFLRWICSVVMEMKGSCNMIVLCRYFEGKLACYKSVPLMIIAFKSCSFEAFKSCTCRCTGNTGERVLKNTAWVSSFTKVPKEETVVQTTSPNLFFRIVFNHVQHDFQKTRQQKNH